MTSANAPFQVLRPWLPVVLAALALTAPGAAQAVDGDAASPAASTSLSALAHVTEPTTVTNASKRPSTPTAALKQALEPDLLTRRLTNLVSGFVGKSKPFTAYFDEPTGGAAAQPLPVMAGPATTLATASTQAAEVVNLAEAADAAELTTPSASAAAVALRPAADADLSVPVAAPAVAQAAAHSQPARASAPNAADAASATAAAVAGAAAAPFPDGATATATATAAAATSTVAVSPVAAATVPDAPASSEPVEEPPSPAISWRQVLALAAVPEPIPALNAVPSPPTPDTLAVVPTLAIAAPAPAPAPAPTWTRALASPTHPAALTGQLSVPKPEVQLALAAPTTQVSAPAPAPTPTPTPAAAAAAAAAAPFTLPAPQARQAEPVLLAAATPKAPPVALPPEPRFDLSINNAPASQVFLQLANGTAYNMLVSPDVSGTLSITLKDTTVPEAMDTMREMFGFEYRITGNRIFVYPNTVQTRLYRVNYLPGRRQGASDIRVTSSAITSAAGGGGGALGASGGASQNNSQNGSSGNRADDNAHVRTTSDSDFWREVQASLAALVGSAGGRSVVLNPAAGVVVVKATPAELRQVENYLKAVQLSIERQVMLEAKIVEVQLSRDSQTGINWAGFGSLGKGKITVGNAAPGTVLAPTGPLTSADGNSIAPGVNLAAGALARGFYGLAFQAANFGALLNFLETQGQVSVLSSPRIATLNNQKAVLKVGSDELYVTGVSTSTVSNGAGSTSSPSLTLQPFFSGISLDVTPQIDDAGTVMLHIHPTISTVTEKNKNIDLGALGSYRLPLATSAVNETDSIVRVRDGQIVAIGGLMKHEQHEERTGTPLLQDMPFVGGAFRQTTTVTSKRELVIMLKPTVIQDDGAWPDAPTFGAPQARSPIQLSPAAPSFATPNPAVAIR